MDDRYLKYATTAARQLLHRPDPLAPAGSEMIIYPVWKEMIHAMLKGAGCPCTKGDHEHCFLRRSRDEQIRFFANHSLSFEDFSSIVYEAVVKILDDVAHERDEVSRKKL